MMDRDRTTTPGEAGDARARGASQPTALAPGAGWPAGGTAPEGRAMGAAAPSGAALPSRRTLWFGFLGAPMVWATNLLAGYAVQSSICSTGTNPEVAGIGLAKLIPIVLCVVAAAIAAAAVVVAYRSWRDTGTGEENPEATVPPDVGRSWFMSYGGLLTSILFLLAIVLMGLVELTVTPC